MNLDNRIATIFRGQFPRGHGMMIQRLREIFGALVLALVLLGCSHSSSPRPAEVKRKPAVPPEPVVNHWPSGVQPGQRIEHGELILDVDGAHRQLNAQHHLLILNVIG